MKKDQMIPGRRRVLRIAACFGAAAVTARVISAGQAQTPGHPAAPPPAAGPQAAPKLKPSAYRLRPMTAENPPGYRAPAPPVRKEPFLELTGLGRSVVLTFDDGPDPTWTPEILTVLREHDVHAMFFVCGEMASYFPDVLRRAADEGHIIGNHTWTHPELPTLTPAKIKNEMERTSELIEKTTGAAPSWFRAPYGAWNKQTFELGAALGMEPLAWTVDTLDWTRPGTDKIVRTVLGGAKPGVVVLSHDGGGKRDQSVAALRRYLPELVDAGYSAVLPHP